MTKPKSNDDAMHQQAAVPPPATGIRLSQHPWFLALVLVVVTFVAYQPTWHAGFIWDDDDHLTSNPAMASVAGLKQIWSSLRVSRYYPLTLTSFWAQRRLWGLDPLPYHAVNVSLQAVNAVLLWLLLRRLQVRGAWVAAAVWAVHPVNVETVAWVTELKNTQSGLFFLLALLAFLRFEDGLRPRDYGLALACGVAAMLSKPSTVVLPGVMLLCIWWQHNAWRLRDFLRVAPLVAFALGMSLLTIAEQCHHIATSGLSEWRLTAAQRLVLAGRAVWFYAGKALWPSGLCFIYPRWELPAHSPAAWLPLAGLVFVAGTLGYFHRTRWARAATFGLGYFVIALLPVIGFFDIYFFRYSFVADHFQYLACIGLITLVASAGVTVFERNRRRLSGLGRFVAAAVLLMLGVGTWKQDHIYKDLETLWRNTLSKNPNAWMAHGNLGTTLQDLGNVPEAIAQYEQALRIKPDYIDAHYNLGNTWLQLGNLPEAIAQYEQALRIKPDFAEAHNNLGNALLQLGNLPEAIAQYEQALRIKPDYLDAHYNLGNALLQSGKATEAIAQYEQALRIKPDFAEAHNNLGNALRQLGNLPEAIGQYEQALRIKPDYAEAHNNLGNALRQLGNLPEAIGQYGQALRIKPDYIEAHYNLGNALIQSGKTSEAITQYEQALRLKPDYTEAHYNLGNALLQSGETSEAITQYEQALRLKPDFADAHNNLGSALAQVGKVQEAIGHYQQALRIKPDFVEAQTNLARARAVR